MAADADSAGVRVFPPLLFVVAALLGFAIERLRPVPFEPAGLRPEGRALGIALVVIGVLLMGWAVALFRRAGTTPNPTRPTTALVVRGPYHFTRNPMYVGWLLAGIGLGLIANALWPIVMMLPAAMLTQRLVIAKEERYLAGKFGDQYRGYAARVRRWI